MFIVADLVSLNIHTLLYNDRYFSTDWQFEMFKENRSITSNIFRSFLFSF